MRRSSRRRLPGCRDVRHLVGQPRPAPNRVRELAGSPLEPAALGRERLGPLGEPLDAGAGLVRLPLGDVQPVASADERAAALALALFVLPRGGRRFRLLEIAGCAVVRLLSLAERRLCHRALLRQPDGRRLELLRIQAHGLDLAGELVELVERRRHGLVHSLELASQLEAWVGHQFGVTR